MVSFKKDTSGKKSLDTLLWIQAALLTTAFTMKLTPAHSQSGSCGQGTYFSRLRFRSFLWFWNSTGYRRKIYQYMKLVTNLNQLTSHRAGCEQDRWDARRWYSWDLFPSDRFVPRPRGEARARYAFHRDEQRKVRGELIKGVDMWVKKLLLALLLAYAAPFALPSLQTNRRKYKVSANLPCPRPLCTSPPLRTKISDKISRHVTFVQPHLGKYLEIKTWIQVQLTPSSTQYRAITDRKTRCNIALGERGWKWGYQG